MISSFRMQSQVIRCASASVHTSGCVCANDNAPLNDCSIFTMLVFLSNFFLSHDLPGSLPLSYCWVVPCVAVWLSLVVRVSGCGIQSSASCCNLHTCISSTHRDTAMHCTGSSNKHYLNKRVFSSCTPDVSCIHNLPTVKNKWMLHEITYDQYVLSLHYIGARKQEAVVCS